MDIAYKIIFPFFCDFILGIFVQIMVYISLYALFNYYCLILNHMLFYLLLVILYWNESLYLELTTCVCLFCEENVWVADISFNVQGYHSFKPINIQNVVISTSQFDILDQYTIITYGPWLHTTSVMIVSTLINFDKYA